MTVEEMRHRMDGDEFQRWGVYYAQLAQQMELDRKVSASRRGK